MAPPIKRKSEVSFLYDISRLLGIANINEAIYPILKRTAVYTGISCCVLHIFKKKTNDVIVEEAYGFDEEEKLKIKKQLRASILKKVAETGIPMLLTRISHKPQFITSSRDLNDFKTEISLICVPVMAEKEILGAFSLSLEFYESNTFKTEFRLLTIIGCMIANTVRALQEKGEELEELKEANHQLKSAFTTQFVSEEIVGSAGKMRDVYELVQKVAKTNATVLIRGESGVGKELFANAIHYNSNRSDKPLIKINCAALPDALIESELFGHEKGAFTGADVQRKGRFEMADQGTIFLDEIGDIPASTQVKILRILQEHELERLGNSRTIKVDVRVIAATNRNLEEMITKNQFREDLFYRLNVFPLYVPPLRERKDDIPTLINHFITKFNKKNGLNINRITTPAIDMMMFYHWPGNIRELENCIERAAILACDGAIHSNHLPPTLQTAQSTGTDLKGDIDNILGNVEKQVILDTLIIHHGNVARTAEQLNITERMLRLRMQKYNVNPKLFKTKDGSTHD